MPSGPRQRILVVDDSTIVLSSLKTALTAAGFDVVTARDLSELAKVQAEAPPNLVLLDVIMPEAFGDDLAAVMRQRGLSCPIYLLSILPDDELEKRARDAGAEGFITKVSGLPRVVERVREILGTNEGSN